MLGWGRGRPCGSRSGGTSTVVVVLLAGILVALVVPITFLVIHKRTITPDTSSRSPVAADGQAETVSFEKYRNTLESQGWDRAAAEAVVRLNLPYFRLLGESSPDELDRTLSTLGRLGPDSHSQQRLTKQPELAGLLAGALEADSKGPGLVLKTIPVSDTVITSLYGLAASPHDSVALAKVLERAGDLARRLSLHNAWDAIGWFNRLPSNAEAQSVYLTWLRSLFESALNSPTDDAIDRAQTFLVIHSPTVRERLESDAGFCGRFLTELWPSYERILASHTEETEWGIYISDPRIWSFLDEFEERGAKLFDSRGPIAVDLLAGPEYQTCRERVFGALESADEETIAALYDPNLRSEPLFVKLLDRSLSAGTLAKALHNLASDPAHAPKLLRYYDGLDDTALTEELGPPPAGPRTLLPGYNVYYLARKNSQGRDITGMDAVMATMDTVELAFMAKGASKGLKAIQQGVKGALEKKGMRTAAGQISQATARDLFPWVIRSGHEAFRLTLAKIREGMTADVTDAIRFAFQKSGLGRDFFRRLTDLEARVFMRADRRVLIDLGELATNRHVLGRYMRETALNAGLAGLMTAGERTLKTETGSQLVRSSSSLAVSATRSLGEQSEAWKRHLSAWWLGNSVGTVEFLEKK